MQVELTKIVEKGGRCFEAGRTDRGGRLVAGILMVGSYVTVRFKAGAVGGRLHNPIVVHVDDLSSLERADGALKGVRIC